jgi:CRISPR-associated protein Cas2
MWLVSYDISSDKPRRGVVKLLEARGMRVQKSVFELHCQKKEIDKLRQKVQKLITPTDSVRYYFLCKGCSARLLLDGVPLKYREQSVIDI